MADSSTDMYWDHAGEDLEDNPLLNTYRTDTPYRSLEGRWGDQESFPYYQTQRLLGSMEETSELLRGYIADVYRPSDNQEETNNETAAPFPIVKKICDRCKQLVQYLTGTRTVIFTMILQGVNLVIQSILEIWKDKKNSQFLVLSCSLMIVFQVLNLLLLIINTKKLVDQLNRRKVSGIMLVQSYFAAIFLFAGLYTTTSRMKASSWKSVHEEDTGEPLLIVVLYAQFLYFSVSTSTLCGTSSVYPHEWYNYIFVAIQMLLSFLYFASVLGHAVTPFRPERPQAVRTLHRLPPHNHVGDELDSPLLRHNERVDGYGTTEER